MAVPGLAPPAETIERVHGPPAPTVPVACSRARGAARDSVHAAMSPRSTLSTARHDQARRRSNQIATYPRAASHVRLKSLF
jgi:hypothetical protein